MNQSAFPTLKRAQYHNVSITDDSGMTLRDYFAAKAMQGLLSANPETLSELIKVTKGSGSVSELSYILANAMLKARTE